MKNKAKLNVIIEDAVKIIKNPIGFYREMAQTGGFVDPIIFLIVMAVVAGLMVATLSLFGAGMAGVMIAGMGAIIMFPIFALISSFISAAILFVIWKLMGSNHSYETAYRCVAYASAIYPITILLSIIPYAGSLIGMAWGVYLMMIAGIEVHQLKKNTVYLVFGILGTLMILGNLSGEMAARRMASQIEGMGKPFGGQFENSNDMTPEKAGEAFGGFLKGLEKATKYPE